jgi:hypothetical protein
VSLSSIPRRFRLAVMERDAGRCTYCGLLQVGQSAIFHVDHVTPRSRGGKTTLDNLALQCPWCSLHKSNKTEGVDPETGARIPLFHPLMQSWKTHFRLEADGTCVGLTPTGRATVEALRMNELLPKAARSLQVLFGMQ